VKRPGPLQRRKRLEQRAVLQRGRRRTIGTRDQREAFKRRVCQGATCDVRDDGPCDGDLQAHHVVPQQAIRRAAVELGLDDRQLASLITDPRNGVAVCRRHHDRHTLARRRLPLSLIGRKHRQFAAELGLERLIDKTYRQGEA
jgi:hypothetical protein